MAVDTYYFDASGSITTLLDYYPESNYSYYSTVYSGPHSVGQSFVGGGGKVSKATFYLQKKGSPTGNVYAELYASTGTHGTNAIPTGLPLSTSEAINVAGLSTSFSLVDFTFSSSYTTTASTTYIIVITYSGGSFSDAVNVGSDTSSPLHTGNASGWHSIDQEWIVMTAPAFDNIFYIYEDIGVYDPDSYWIDDANAFDGSILTSATTNNNAGGVSSNYLIGKGTNTPTSGGEINQVRARIYGFNTNVATTLNASIYTDSLAELLGTAQNNETSAGWGSYVTLDPPSGGWTWEELNILEVKINVTLGGFIFTDAYKVEIEVTSTTPEPRSQSSNMLVFF